MTQVNGIPVTENLIKILKEQYCHSSGDETTLDWYVESLMGINDYLLDRLAEASTNDVEQLKKISTLLLDVKGVRDFNAKLNTALKEIAELRNPENQ